MSPETYYAALTSQPLTETLREVLGDIAVEWFEIGNRGESFPEERMLRNFDEKHHDQLRAIHKAGQDLFCEMTHLPAACTLINRWATGGAIEHSPFIFSRYEIREPGAYNQTCALRIDRQIYAAPGSLPGVRFPDDTIFMHRSKLNTAAASYKKLRDYKKDNQVQRAKNFGDTLYWAKQLPEQSELHQLALEGPQAMLRHWFGDRYTGALHQNRPAAGTRMDRNEERIWSPPVEGKGMVPVPAENKFGVTKRYLLMPLEDAILLKLQAENTNDYKVWDIGQ